MDRVAVFVDAGYLFAQGSVTLSSSKVARSRIQFDHEKAITFICRLAEELSGLPLLRVYWYDGTSSGPSAQHLALAHSRNVKVRLGMVNSHGQQKGVDSLIITDMISLARNGGMADAVLLSGDEDLRVGVQHAQEHGVRVHLVGIQPCRGNQSLTLMQEADTTHELVPADVQQFLMVKEQASVVEAIAAIAAIGQEAATNAVSDVAATLNEVAALVARGLQLAELPAIIETIRAERRIPQEQHGMLLGKSRDRLNRYLSSTEKGQIGEAFLAACEDRLSEASATEGADSADAHER